MSFCNHCGSALTIPTAPAGAGPSGWALATAGMERPAAPMGPLGPLVKEELAGWWARLGAWILDGLIFGLLAGVVGGLAALIAWMAAPEALEDMWQDFVYSDTSGYGYPNDGMGAYVVLLLLGGLLAIAWEVFWLTRPGMAKPGQSIAGFRVMRVDGMERLSRGRAAGRAVGRFLYSVPNIGFLASIASAFTIGLTAGRQSLHDMFAGTACVKKDALRRRGIGPDAMDGIGMYPAAPAVGGFAPQGGYAPTPPPPPPPGTPPPSPHAPPPNQGPFV